MEKKFTRAMLCEEFKSKCRECPLFCDNNFKSLPCWLLDESDIQDIMKDYPYVDVKIRTMFNDIETRLTAVEEKVEKKVEKKDEPKFTMFAVVDKKLYDKLEAKHEADCRLISEYDLENKRLKKQNEEQNDDICTLYSKYTSEQKERIRCEAVIEDIKRQLAESGFHVEKLKEDEERLRDKYKRMEAVIAHKYKELDDARNINTASYKIIGEQKEKINNLEDEIDKYRSHIAELKNSIFDLKNAENERDHYKGLYSSKCDDYDNLLAKQLKTQKELKHAEEVGDDYKLLYDTTCDNYDKLEEKYNKLLKDYKLLSESNNNHATDNVELEGKLEAKSLRIAALEEKLRNQRTNLASLQEKYEDALKMNKAREDVYYQNQKLGEAIKAKDREIDLLRAELDKYRTDECDDRWID